MPDPKNQVFKPNFSSELNIESIISAPLVAASKANVVMVTGQTRFLLDYCFKKSDDGDTYEPVMIEMSMIKAVIDHTKEPNDADYLKKVKLNFSLPLLTLIPINSLVIDKVSVDFDMEITSVTSKSYKHDNVLDKKAQLNGKISYDPGRDSNVNNKGKSQMSSRLKVNVNAGPLPLPVGVLTVIDMYTKAIQPVSADKLLEK